MADKHPQGMNHRNYDGKTGNDSIDFAKACLVVFLVVVSVMLIVISM